MPTKWSLQLEHSALWFFQCLRFWLLAVTVREEKHACSRWNALYNNIFVMFVIANVISKQALGDWGLETFTAHHLTLSWLDQSLYATVNPCCSCKEMFLLVWLLLSFLFFFSFTPPHTPPFFFSFCYEQHCTCICLYVPLLWWQVLMFLLQHTH